MTRNINYLLPCDFQHNLKLDYQIEYILIRIKMLIIIN